MANYDIEISRTNNSLVARKPKHWKPRSIQSNKVLKSTQIEKKAKIQRKEQLRGAIHVIPLESFPYSQCFIISTKAANFCKTLFEKLMWDKSDNWAGEYHLGPLVHNQVVSKYKFSNVECISEI